MESDEALYARFVRGDLSAFDMLYGRYERPVYGFLRSYVRNDADAEDLLEDLFVALAERTHVPGEVTSFRAWIYQVARNLAANHLRSARRAHIRGENWGTLQASATSSDDALVPLLQVERTERLSKAVARLPAHLEQLYRCRAAGMTYDEAARALDIPVGTVRSRLHDLVSRLKKEFES